MYAEVVVDRPMVRRSFTGSAGPESPPEPGPEAGAPDERESGENPLALTFHYHIPPDLAGQVRPGHLVAVPFRQQQLQAIVINLSDTSPVEQTRPIAAILDPVPVLTPGQIGLALWLSRECLAPLATCLKYFLPPGSGRKSEAVLKPVEAGRPVSPPLTAREQALLSYIRQRGSARLADADPVLVKTLLERNLVRRETVLAGPRLGPKVDRMVELLISPDEVAAVLPGLGRESKQAGLLLHLASLNDPLPPLAEVLEEVHCSRQTVKTLEENGWVRVIPRETRLALAPVRRAAVEAGAAPAEEPGLEALAGSEAGQQVLRYLSGRSRPQLLPEVMAATGTSRSNLNTLLKKGLIARFDEPDRIALTVEPEDLAAIVVELRGAQKHADVLHLLLAEEGPVWVGWIYAQTGASRQTLADLVEAGVITMAETRRWRDPLAGRSFSLETAPTLTAEQQAVWQAVRKDWQPGVKVGQPALLHGVTGSGKTEIYLQAMAVALAAGQGAIMLVPEIALAAQTVERLSARCPGRGAGWHSAVSPGERYDTWERVRAGELPIVVGPRSALFAPVPRPGLIVIDEEHEPAYKQRDRAPVFHARDAALELGRLSSALVIMGSATPDVATYRKAERGEFCLLNLPNRILAHTGNPAVQQALLRRRLAAAPAGAAAGRLQADLVALPLPRVEVVDLRDELKAGNRTIFSRALQNALRETLERGEQAILFLNRRGTASFVICRDCGFVMHCPRCETILTYHANEELMVCHYCGYRQRPLNRCPECHGEHIRYFGLGTERVEQTVKKMFPAAQTIRWDQDTTRQKGSHDAFLQHFAAGRANVLVGTQMVAKGLDLPLVTLVGVISADTALYLPDFRAAERTFQLLMQVAGRAGRSPLGGRVIVQTYNPDQVAIEAAANHDYIGFYQAELAFRREQRYPPFKRLALLLYSGAGAERSRADAFRMARKLRQHIERWGLPAVEVIGPTPDYVHRVRSQYRWHILLRADDPAGVLRPLLPLPQGWRVDVDPVTLL